MSKKSGSKKGGKGAKDEDKMAEMKRQIAIAEAKKEALQMQLSI